MNINLLHRRCLKDKLLATDGFTLLELLVTVMILGLLAAIALPNLMGQISKARMADAKGSLGAINRAQEAYYFENAVFAPSLQDLSSQVTIGFWNGTAYESSYYLYSIIGTPTQTRADHLANPKPTYDNDLKTLTSAILKSGSSFTSVVCQANYASQTPQIVDKDTCNNGKFSY